MTDRQLIVPDSMKLLCERGRASSLKAFAPALPLAEPCFVAAVEIGFSCRLTSSRFNGLQP